MTGDSGKCLAAPQGFEPRYADPESAVLPLNEGAAIAALRGMRLHASANPIVGLCHQSVNHTRTALYPRAHENSACEATPRQRRLSATTHLHRLHLGYAKRFFRNLRAVQSLPTTPSAF